MDTIIGLKFFRNNIQKIADRIARGETFIVVRRSKAVFRLDPIRQHIDRPNWIDAKVWKKTAAIFKK